MNKLKDSLKKGDFVITAEVAPPKGTDIKQVCEELEIYRDCVSAVNITDNQSSVMRASGLAIANIMIKKSISPIYQITTRDRNRIALQSELLGASIIGVNNILCLTGDGVEQGDHPQAKPVFDIDSTQLIEAAGALNKGKDASGKKLNQATDFFIGAACFPQAAPLEPEIIRTRKKVKAGAMFLQTQAVYDSGQFKTFMSAIKDLDVFLLAGIVVLKSAAMARYMNQNVSGINIPEALIKELEGSDNQLKKGIEIAARLIVELKEFCNGIHIMPLGKASVVPEILKKANLI